MSIRIGVIAGRPDLLAAKLTVAAGDGKRHNNAIATLQISYTFSNLLHDSHEFVTEDIAGFHRRDKAVVEVQVGTAYGGPRYFQDRVVRVQQKRIGDTQGFKVVLSLPTDSFHSRNSFEVGRLWWVELAGLALEFGWQPRGSGNLLGVCGFLHSANDTSRTMRLTLCARQLAGFYQCLEVAKIL